MQRGKYTPGLTGENTTDPDAKYVTMRTPPTQITSCSGTELGMCALRITNIALYASGMTGAVEACAIPTDVAVVSSGLLSSTSSSLEQSYPITNAPNENFDYPAVYETKQQAYFEVRGCFSKVYISPNVDVSVYVSSQPAAMLSLVDTDQAFNTVKGDFCHFDPLVTRSDALPTP